MKVIYITLVILNILILLVGRKKFSFISVYLVSSMFYYLNLFFGQIFIKSNEIVIGYDIHKLTWVIMIFNMLFIMIFQIVPNVRLNYRNTKRKQKKSVRGERVSLIFIDIILFLISFSIIVQFNLFSLETFDKLAILNSSGFFVEYFKQISLFIFVVMYTSENIKYNKISHISIMYFMFIIFMLGHRSYIVIGMLAIIFNYINKNLSSEKNMISFLKKNKKIIFALLGIAIFVYVIKGIYAALLTGQYELVKSRLSDINYYMDSIKLAESNVITKYVDTVVSMNYRVSKSTYPIILTFLVPFVSRFMEITNFSSMLEQDVFVTARPGSLGSSFIAEAFSNGGILMIGVVIILILLLLVIVFNFYFNSNDNYIRAFWLLVGIDLTFYIHRNSLATVAIRVRSYVYILILFMLLRQIFRAINKFLVDKNKIK